MGSGVQEPPRTIYGLVHAALHVIDDLINQTIEKTLDLIGINHHLFGRCPCPKAQD